MRSELKKLGLSEKEIEIYLAGLKAGPLTVQKLAEIAKVKRPTTYDVLARLESLSLVTPNLKGNKKIYEMASPSRLLKLIEEEKNLVKKEDSLIKIIVNLEAIARRKELATDVKIYKDWEGIEEVMISFAKTDAPFILYIQAII
jgi:sugar-specific transcriptional regulator TrmB